MLVVAKMPHKSHRGWCRSAGVLWAAVAAAGLIAAADIVVTAAPYFVGYRALTLQLEVQSMLGQVALWFGVGAVLACTARLKLAAIDRAGVPNAAVTASAILLFPLHVATVVAVGIALTAGVRSRWSVVSYQIASTLVGAQVANAVRLALGSHSRFDSSAELLVALSAAAAYVIVSQLPVFVLDKLVAGDRFHDACWNSVRERGWSLAQTAVTGTTLALLWSFFPLAAVPQMLLILGESAVGKRLLALATELGHARDETRLEREHARTDGLTGLLNRRAFDEELQKLRPGGGLLLLDLDHFKRVNDTYGHQAGDRVLKASAAAIQETVRPGDICARYGGEELCVLLPAVVTVDGLMQVAERVRRAVAAIEFDDIPALHITASIGGSMLGADGNLAILSRADEAVYWVKDHGRNQVRVIVADPTATGVLEVKAA
jgi:diguanylate cyclase (GGDEF)-like protein